MGWRGLRGVMEGAKGCDGGGQGWDGRQDLEGTCNSYSMYVLTLYQPYSIGDQSLAFT